VGTWQIAVTGCDTAPRATWPVAVHLDVPQAWAEDPARRGNARVPAEGPFQTKPESALALLDQARAWGVPSQGVVADADSGDSPHLLAGLDARHERDVVAVRSDFRVSRQQQPTGPVARTDERLQRVPRAPWRTLRWRQGTTGWRRKKFMAVRCGRITRAGPRQVGWRVGERATQGQPEERQYSWSNLPASTRREELGEYAHRRDAVEPCHEEAKGELGWDQDQGRLWPGFPRQAVTVMLADSFLVWLELQQRHHQPRRGRPRDPCAPAAGSP
jgi:SRSO17 transposase